MLHLCCGIKAGAMNPLRELIQASKSTACRLGDHVSTLNISFYEIILHCLENLMTVK